MVIKRITYTPSFWKRYHRLPLRLQQKTKRTIECFRQNPFHPSLRLHKLRPPWEGCWSISVTKHYRIMFESDEDGTVHLFSVGTHAIYE